MSRRNREQRPPPDRHTYKVIDVHGQSHVMQATMAFRDNETGTLVLRDGSPPHTVLVGQFAAGQWTGIVKIADITTEDHDEPSSNT